MTGKIKTLVRDRMFGFITVEGQAKDLFFHAKELAPGLDYATLNEGQMLSFEVVDGPKGPSATNVALA
jgi:CspA family cold shock protein